MNNTYSLITKSITKALNAIDNFNSKMELFETKYNNYTHEATLLSIEGNWGVSLTMKDGK